MSSEVINTLLLTTIMAVVVGAGAYVTKNRQPAELTRLREQEEAIRLAQAEVETLLQQEAAASVEAQEALARWNARYKILPATLSSPEVVQYLNALSSVGFRSFDLTLGGISANGTHSVYTYNITGEAYFESLYGFIWNLENSAAMYRIRDLEIQKSIVTRPNPETGVDRMEVMARFSMAVDAYFAGGVGMSAPDSLISIPASAYPPRRPFTNLFFPHILETLPPNTDDLVDVEEDSLMSVVGGSAVFLRGEEMRTLRTGDRVYLGRLAVVDPNRAVVVAELNKGGLRERIELRLATGERFRQAFGSTRLERAAGPVLTSPPPAPGTPDAIRRGTYRPATIPANGRPAPAGN
jgi:hypothetical protein